ncbi:TetR family transcriptional regulator [Microbacterium sp. CIAB417]|uniref:TetR family transcriptional regulator n=1 Tax=Microbacterium sp. CIAB417 TaxID=2860287 RepID=UPI001FAD340B|nr:TetR family transcriptional regulator [Microbacterium sp. CIAB417]
MYLLIRDGYAATSMKAIAAGAGVSAQTVQLHGPKHALLIAAFETSFAGDEGAHSLTERPLVAETMAEPEFETARARYVAFLTEANRRSAAIVQAIDGGGGCGCGGPRGLPRARGAAPARHAAERGMVRVSRPHPRRVGRGGGGRAGALTGPGTYLHFTHARGWSDEQYGAWVATQLTHLADALPPTGR